MGVGRDFPRGCCLQLRARRPGHMETPQPVPANTWDQCDCFPRFSCKHVLWGQMSERWPGCPCWAPWQVRGGEGVGAPASELELELPAAQASSLRGPGQGLRAACPLGTD